MSYFNQIAIKAADSPSIDAFGRWRVSDPFAIFDSKQLYDTGSLVWTTKVVGNSTASFVPNNAAVLLYASGSNSQCIRQTRKRHIYQPGKSQLVVMTGNFSGSQSDVIKRIGYMDQSNGLYFCTSGSSFGVGIRSNTSGTPVDTFISQSDWNLDKFDGTGPSGKIYNLTASQIHFIDMEWLGVGRVRYGVYQGGIPYYVHQLTHINELPTVYMSTPNLPIRYSLTNSGSGEASMLHICSMVSSEGGRENNGSVRSVLNPFNGTINSSVYMGMIAVRLKSACLDSSIIPLDITSAQLTANCVYELSLQLNPSGSLPWVWQDLPNSVVQYATGSATTYAIAIEGTKYFSGITAGNQTVTVNIDPTFALGSDVDGNQDILVLAWRGIQGNAGNASTTLEWREL